LRIGHATSLDGVTWIKDTNNPVMDVGPEGSWDDGGVGCCSVIYDGSQYHMWYIGQVYLGHRIIIGHATSPDGVTWTRDPQNPILEYDDTSWEGVIMDSPEVILDDSIYRMWYLGGRYHVESLFMVTQIGYATSEDGSVWTKYADNPVIPKGPAGSWDDKSIEYFSVIDSAGVKYKMWYQGNEAAIGYAYSDKRVPWLTVPKPKPVFDSTDIITGKTDLDGVIYIVPYGTVPDIDTINKYMVVSTEVFANTEVQFPLTDLAIGHYTVYAISNQGFINNNLETLTIVPDASVPKITLEEGTVYQPNAIKVRSTKDGMLYLVTKGTPSDLSKIKTSPYLVDSINAGANVLVEFSTSGLLKNRDYWLYAVDDFGIISERDTVTIRESTSIEEEKKSGINIYPNPAIDLLTITMEQPGQHSLEINSLNGQQMYVEEIDETSHQIDLSSFRKGVYLITIRSKDFVTIRKVIKM